MGEMPPTIAMDESGFCPHTLTFHSKRKPVPLPSDPSLTFPAFILSFDPQPPPHWPAFVDSTSGFILSHCAFHSRIRSAAAGLAAFGLHPGDVALLIAPNSIHSPVLILATMLAGGIITLANPINSPPEIARQVADVRPAFLYTTPSLLPKLRGCPPMPVVLLPEPGSDTLAGDIQNLASRLQTMSSDPASVQSELTSFLSHVQTQNSHPPMVPVWPCHTITLAKLLSSDPSLLPAIPARQDDTALLMYSSGTTGTSKGVIMTHKNLIAMVSIQYSVYGGVLSPDSVYLCILPISHVYGLVMFACLLPVMGCSVVMAPKFDFLDMLKHMQQYKVTDVPAVPPILLALTKMDLVGKFDLSSFKTIMCGGAPLSKELVTAFKAQFPKVSIKQGYGLTESTGFVANASTDEEEFEHYDSVGLLVPNTEARIFDISSGRFLGPNEKGELWFRGPTVMQGYHNNPIATVEAVDAEGWLHTGDLCYIDEHGYFHVVDRLKELIKYKGWQVAPAELEAVLLSHPEVADAAVISLPDEAAGEIPMAFVVKRTGSSITEAAVMAFVSEQVTFLFYCMHQDYATIKVAPYKKVRKVAFMNEIPKSPSGKILRRELKSRIQSKL